MPSHTNPRQTRVAGVPLSNPERVLYPEQGLTKAALAAYYADIADWILPHVIDRPLSLLRCPRGEDETCFYQRHPGDTPPAGVESVRLAEQDGPADYIVLRDLDGLLGLVQWGVLEIHPWGARADTPDRPDRLVMDLDPGRGATWPDVIHGARWLHGRLSELGLGNFVRTTGGKGLHVVVPLTGELGWDDLKRFAHGLARQLAEHDPQRYTVHPAKAERINRVFVDYLRNARGASSIASYSTRAHAHAPVATPITWDELDQLESPTAFTVANIPERLGSLLDDPWHGFFDLEQTITPAMLGSLPAEG